LADVWQRHYGHQLASARNDSYRLKQFNAFRTNSRAKAVLFGELQADQVTLLDIEAYRDLRKAAGLSSVSVNQDLRLLRKIFSWGVRKGLVELLRSRSARSPSSSSNERYRATVGLPIPMTSSGSSLSRRPIFRRWLWPF
jgi:site-specific recombinase XerD